MIVAHVDKHPPQRLDGYDGASTGRGAGHRCRGAVC